MHSDDRHQATEVTVEAFRNSSQGRGRTVLISGPGGSGKTELLVGFVDFAVESGALVLRATGARMESNLSLGVIGQLLRSAGLPAEVSARVDRLLDEGSTAAASFAAKAELLGHTHAQLFRETCSILVDLAQERTVVLAIDDIQYADEPSLQALLYLQRRIASARIMVVATEWQPMPRMLHPLFLAEFTSQSSSAHIRLGSLSVPETAELLRAVLARDICQETATAFHAASGGSPLLVKALASDAARVTASDSAAGTPVRLDGHHHRHAVLMSLHRWGPQLHAVARALAVLDAHATPALMAELLAEKQNTVMQGLAALEATGIVVGERFRHPVYRQAVLDELSEMERSALHLRAARLLHDHGACSLDVAHHLVAYVTPADPWAVEVLHTAAQRALAHGELSQAAELLETARKVSQCEQERASLAATLSRIQSALNPSSVGRLLHPLTSACTAGRLSDRDAATLSRHLLWRGLASDAAGTLDWVGRTHQEADHQIAAELHLTAEWLRFTHPLLSTGSAGGTRPGESASCTVALLSAALDDKVAHHAEQVLQSCLPGHTLLESVQAAIAIQLYGGRADHAAQWCHKLSKGARDQGAVEWTATLTAMLADMALRAGDLIGAERYARQALDEVPVETWGVGIADPLATLLSTLTAMGALDEAEKVAGQVVPKAVKGTIHWPKFLLARGRYHLAAQHLEAARGDLGTCGALLESWGLDFPLLFPWRSTLAHVHIRLGQPEQARELLDAQAARPGAHEPWVRGRTLRALAGAGEQGKRQVLLREAAAQLTECGDQLELALALADLSSAHDKQNESVKARLMAARAHKVAMAAGADPVALGLPALQAEIRPAAEQPAVEAAATVAIPAQRTAPFAALSDAEQRVAALAASGYSNREIGRKLFITTSTVEQHLTRVYRKLSVKRRAELSVKLAPMLVEFPLLA
ncbi:LuxR family transcriptional regulator [Streptomyces viridiviolaceus]|uniref:AAA family ATPase n=1 Tax=Streptomyces viridiviolaceus TaxID=68282 RepID=A0ABW2DR57_9ACTN|nr:LuxR family transcriptional regulator [Streptomyces viridiviolaceus]GHB20691.1 LuxR family transcriptional regulator [Streptomyces viridiviolaceus]